MKIELELDTKSGPGKMLADVAKSLNRPTNEFVAACLREALVRGLAGANTMRVITAVIKNQPK